MSAAKKAEHPTYAVMVQEAIASLREHGGSSRAAIKKWIGDTYGKYIDNLKMFELGVRQAIKRGVDSGKLVQVKQSFKLGDAVKAELKKKKDKAERAEKKEQKEKEKAAKETHVLCVDTTA
eukprot:TRINITY_DN7484_c0_g7_i2.p2 TRINITY_DN7484_c0_g7~~TRINITY_DN7484_c0_g7_i2.p2  ORF type:complete len:139 (-),score=66.41 TRINITY_DN7484_c0_g7_i2:6-368(-)